eukprot:gene28305-34177_t
MSKASVIKTGSELERVVEETCHRYQTEGPSGTACPCDLTINYPKQFPTVMYIPGLDALPIWGIYSIEQLLKDRSREIRKEYRGNAASATKEKIDKDVELKGPSSWEVINLMADGCWIEENTRLFPRTVELLRSLPLMQTGLGYVYFSVLSSRTFIRGHCGVTNAKLRIQLPIVLDYADKSSSEMSYITIAGEKREYKLHDPIIFDDSFPHSVTNNHASKRVVLIIDIWHPRSAKSLPTFSAQCVNAYSFFNDLFIFSLSPASREVITATFPPATPEALQAEPRAVIPRRKVPETSRMPNTLSVSSSSSDYDWMCKLLLIGDSGVGKTSVLLRFADDFFTESFITTIGVDFKIKTLEYHDSLTKRDLAVKMQIWDTAGPERFRTITSSYYRGCTGILLCFAVADRESFVNATQMWTMEINKYAPTTSVLLVGLKGDLTEQRQVPFEEAQQAAADLGLMYRECSSKTREGVDEVFWAMLHTIFSDESAKASIINDTLARKRNNQSYVGTGKAGSEKKTGVMDKLGECFMS